jgi:DNA-binding XRE family transcriptional regulator
MTSQRTDGRGHWPAGKRRHPDAGTWSRTRLALTKFLDDHYDRRYDGISQKQLARDLGVSDRTVRRWLKGEDRPDEETQAAIAQWLAEWREAIK